GQIYPIHGEASTVFSSCRLKNSVDRIIMNLPEKAKYFLDVACKLIKPGGIIHYYTFASDDPIENAKNEVCNMLMKYCNLSFSITSLRIVKVVAPRKWQVAVDIKCFK
ncbi:MAG: class I SAM-dependent methyltransferase family protein, partial [Candidatus Methanomethylicota archaeon]